MTKIFVCGLCKKKGKVVRTTREGLRKHLREEHRIMKALTNSYTIDKKKSSKQSWWIEEEKNGN